VLREFAIPQKNAGTGELYLFPAVADYQNYIVAAHELDWWGFLNFETRDGKTGSHSTGNRYC